MTLVLDELTATPTGSLLLSDIRDEIGNQMDLTDTARYTTARLNAAINWAIRDSWHDLAEIVTYEYTTSLDVKDYQLPSDFIGLKAIWLEGLTSALYSGEWPLLTSYEGANNPSLISSDDYVLVNDASTKYIRFRNDSITAGLTLRIEYYRKWSPLDTEAETTGIPLAYIIPATKARLLADWELINPRYDVDDIRTRIALAKEESSRALKQYKVSLAPTYVSRRRIGVGE